MWATFPDWGDFNANNAGGGLIMGDWLGWTDLVVRGSQTLEEG